MSKISVVMSDKRSNHHKILYDHIRISFNGVLMCKICINTNMLVEHCALMRIFQKAPGYALIGACVLIRTNTVLRETHIELILILLQQ